MDDLLRKLLDDLDVVGEKHGEIYDTECRERMGDAICNLFIKPQDGYRLTDDFGLHSKKANRDVTMAIETYIRDANALASRTGLNEFHQRLAAFQNGDVKSNLGGTYFDDYFGWMNPVDFDEQGNVTGSI